MAAESFPDALHQTSYPGLQLECSPPNLVPYGQGYTTNQGCAIEGAEPGSTTLSGTVYLASALNFYQSHMWRNFGIIVALWMFFIGLLLFSIESLPAAGSSQAILLYKRGGGGKFVRAAANTGSGPRDEEEGNNQQQISESPSNTDESPSGDVHAVETWVECIPLTYAG